MGVRAGYKKTEVGIIPEDWRVIALDQLATLKSGGTPSTFNLEYWDGDILWCTPTDITALNGSRFLFTTERKITEQGLKASSAKLLPMGTILMTSRATIGECAISGTPISTNQGFKNLICYSNIDNIFLYYYLITQKQRLKSLSNGSTFLEISINQLKSYKVGIPYNKQEQSAIAKALSDIDDLIIKLEKLIDKKQLIKQGTMQELLNPFDKNGKLKEGWEEKKLSNTATLKARIGWQGLTTAEYKAEGDYLLITGTEFQNGFINWDDCHYVDYERYKQDRNIQISNEDVLVTKDGTIGKVAFIQDIPKPATLNSGVFVIRPINRVFDPEFFFYVLMSDIFIQFLNQLSAGSTINHLYQKDLIHFTFYVPQDISIQKEIAKTLADMDKDIKLLNQKLSKIQQIKQGMMQQLLTGQIRLIEPQGAVNE